MKLKAKVTNKLSTKLISFLPILKAGLDELYEHIKEVSFENPFIEVRNKKFITVSNLKNAITDKIEALSTSESSFYEDLVSQIENSHFFPTEKSRFIALLIAEDITPDGFFDGNEEEIALSVGVDVEKVKKIRERFKYLTPTGVGAKDIKECFLFQLDNLDIDEELYLLVKNMINDLENLDKFYKHKRYNDAIKIIKDFKTTPALEYSISEEIIPEIIVINNNGNLEIRLNEEFYPEIFINEYVDDKYSKEKLKEARSLVDALEMRKSTLKKIALMIVELQYDFFKGGVIKPMKIQDLADELEFAPSTISRAIANKYLLCDRGIIPLKNFFSTAINEEVSANQIKEEIKNIIKNEDKNKPLSDDKICEFINEKFNIKLVRRTITKYREAINIPSSRERKRLYKTGVSF
ncbi:RNA polymerase factor sigma-54 [Caminibacter mediatlanticus]|uniref:RNA polymerase sigma-54 factor n=1 Tax=Caminibacter mediatlanticus TB-2 TaxID=391592 RepID=A0AAI9AHH6_9BACT|nr:RNA polymerase factor sigma-54 [Caminibacter mediatlanticus]EDM23727.1 RNA polymerase sigma-54 factor [Caminibacter mediatlanticus TB-2]